MKASKSEVRPIVRRLEPEPLFKGHGAGEQETSAVGYTQPLAESNQVSFLRLPEVKAVTGLSKTSLYELIREQSFPPPVRLGNRAVAWVRSEVNQWATDRILASRSARYPTGEKLLPIPVRSDIREAVRRSA